MAVKWAQNNIRAYNVAYQRECDWSGNILKDKFNTGL
jgi:hypothetical protein